jgi:cytochrome c553
MVEDDQGFVHLIARGTGQVISFDPEDPTARLDRPVCSEPRGIAFDEVARELVVACRSGEVVWFSELSFDPIRTANVGIDLRDVVVGEEELLISTHRLAEVLHVSRDGELLEADRPATVSADGNGLFEPHVANRMLGLEDGRVVLQHQRSNITELFAGYYTSQLGCSTSGISHNTFSLSDPSGNNFRGAGILPGGVMLDIALNAAGTEYAVLTTGVGATSVYQGRIADDEGTDPCDLLSPTEVTVNGTASAIAFDGQGHLIIHYASERRLDIVGVGSQTLGSAVPTSPGQDLFYQPTPQGIACATCHPEGGDDGTTWSFASEGQRRTQPIAGRLMATAPLHWKGELADFRAVVEDTLVRRMGGEKLSDDQMTVLGNFIEGLPPSARRGGESDPLVVEGEVVFGRLGCGTCHSGDLFTDNLNHDVGTGAEYQTPSLVGLLYRLPVMHDGCAKTVEGRFSECGGDSRHGDYASLSEDEMTRLVAFLESL